MEKVIMTEDKLDKLMRYYLEERHYDRLKYFWEVSVPKHEENSFFSWLHDCECLGFIYAFAAVERSKDCTVFYGFSNFEVVKRKNMKCMELHFTNNDILYQHFMQWREEGAYFAIPIMLRLHLELNDLLDGEMPLEFEHYKEEY